MSEQDANYGYWAMLRLNPLPEPTKKEMPFLKKLFKDRANDVCDKIVSKLWSLDTKKDKKASKRIFLCTLCSCDWTLAEKTDPNDKYYPDLVFVVKCPDKDKHLLEGTYRGQPQLGNTGFGIVLPIIGDGNQPFIPNKVGKPLLTLRPPSSINKVRQNRYKFG